jgi:hypothetical protein
VNVLIIAVTASRRVGVASDVEALTASGANVTLLTSRADAWPGLDPRVRVVDLAEAEGRMPLVSSLRRASAAARGLLGGRRAGTVPARPDRSPEPAPVPAGPPADQGRRPDGTVGSPGPAPSRAMGSGRPGTGASRPRELARRVYRGVRPWLLWRAARRSVLPALDLGSMDLVLVADAQAVPIGWHVARGHPHTEVAFALDRARLVPGDGPTMPYGGRGPSDEAVAERGEEWRS